MAKKKRESRKKLSKKFNMLKPIEPIDILKLGTDEDPCFGKHFDLTEDECKVCGDCNLCQIVFNQKTVKLRSEMESKDRFKDLELVGNSKVNEEAKALIKKLKRRDLSESVIIKKLERRFGLDKEQAKVLIKTKK